MVTDGGLSESDEGVGEEGGDGDVFDVATGDEEGGNPGDNDTPCNKVDLLFVIDNSLSMEDEQTSLISSFPGFIDGIQTRLPSETDWHLGITTTDLYMYNGPGCLAMGGLVTKTGGDGSSNQMCGPYAAGLNYMTTADNLGQSFSCAAQVGIQGYGDEQPMLATLEALGPNLNAQHGCNKGFSRPDALLVLVLITDEEDDHESNQIFGSPGDPPDWYDDLVALRGEIESNVVVLSLVGPVGPDPAQCPLRAGPLAVEGSDIAHRLVEFTSMFTHGFVGRVCEASYDEFFNTAIDAVDTACNDFTPPP